MYLNKSFDHPSIYASAVLQGGRTVKQLEAPTDQKWSHWEMHTRVSMWSRVLQPTTNMHMLRELKERTNMREESW